MKTKQRKSLKGQWGKVGAPPKATKFPKTPFTMNRIFALNPDQCQLTLRVKVNAGLDGGDKSLLVQLPAKRQPGGAVGRPAPVFVLREHFTADMVVVKDVATKKKAVKKPAKSKPAKKKSTKKSSKPVETPAPATPAPDASPAPATTTTTVTVAEVTAPATESVEQAPAPASTETVNA